MNIVCDKCHKPFEVSTPEAKDLHSGVREHYIRCTECGAETCCYYSNERVRELQDIQRTILHEISKLHRSEGDSGTEAKIRRLQDEYQDNKSKIKYQISNSANRK